MMPLPPPFPSWRPLGCSKESLAGWDRLVYWAGVIVAIAGLMVVGLLTALFVARFG